MLQNIVILWQDLIQAERYITSSSLLFKHLVMDFDMLSTVSKLLVLTKLHLRLHITGKWVEILTL